MALVLVTTGKHESVDTAEVRIFDNNEAAELFCKKKSTGPKKYWTKAEIVLDGLEISLCNPSGDY